MDTHVIGGEIAYGVGGMVLALIGRFLWDKLSRSYVTQTDFERFLKQHLETCEARKALADTKLSDKVTVIQKVVLELAVKAGIAVDQYKDLTK